MTHRRKSHLISSSKLWSLPRKSLCHKHDRKSKTTFFPYWIKKWHRKFLSLVVPSRRDKLSMINHWFFLTNFWCTRQWFLMKWSFPNCLDRFDWIKKYLYLNRQDETRRECSIFSIFSANCVWAIIVN
jgi:hypothetical protein